MALLLRPWPLMLLAVAVVAGWAAGPVSGQTVRGTIDSTASIIHYTGTAPLHDWTGTSRRVDGRFVLVPNRPDSSRAVIRVPVASFDSGNDRRDRGMRDVTEADTYPFVTFRGTDVAPAIWGRGAAGYRGTWAVTGTLTFHGQTHPVADTVRVDVMSDSVRIRAQFPVSLTQFGVERPGFMGLTVGDTIRIDAQLVGPRTPDSVDLAR
jgi:polyisoprenoid-binding protein YceI